MKSTSFAVATFVALSLIGCANNSNPVQTETAGAVLSKSAAGEPAFTDDRGGRENRVEGTIRAINIAAGTVSIGATVIATNSSTKIERNGIRVTLASFRIGDRGQARLVTGTNLATKLEASTLPN